MRRAVTAVSTATLPCRRPGVVCVAICTWHGAFDRTRRVISSSGGRAVDEDEPPKYKKMKVYDSMVPQLIGEEGLERAYYDVQRWRKRRQTVLNAVSKGYDVKRAAFLANLAHLQYFDQHWNSKAPGGNQSLHPDEFSLPLQFRSGYAADRLGLPEGVGRVEPASAEFDWDWEYDGRPGRIRQGIVYHDGSDTTGMFFVNPKRRWVVLAFRGSTTRNDTLTNFSFDKVSWDVDCDGAADCSLHRGFYHAYKSIARAVTRTTRRLFKHGKYDKLYVTGHSLGGAIAVLASAHLASELGQASVDVLESGVAPPLVKHMECFTFGAPKVGNQAFADYCDKHVPRTWRHVNDEDAVPSLPPKWAGFTHAGMLCHMNSNGIWVGKGTRATLGVVEDGFALSETASDHWMRGYKYMLREFRQALYVPDETSVVLAQSWQIYLNSRNSVREVATIGERAGGEGASARKISPASYVQVRHFPVPARSLLVAALNRAFGIGLYETDAVIKEAGRLANMLDYIWDKRVTFDLFHFSFFSVLMEPHQGTRALSMAQSIARVTFNRFDNDSDGFLLPVEFENLCRSIFALDVDMASVRQMFTAMNVDPTYSLSFEEVFLVFWAVEIHNQALAHGSKTGSSLDQRPDCPWYVVQELNRTIHPFPSPEECRYRRVTVPGRRVVPELVQPSAQSSAYEDLEMHHRED